jgi:hypothetical protein
MILALLAGRKTQTRRQFSPRTIKLLKAAVKLGETNDVFCDGRIDDPRYACGLCPYGVVGDRLWVREALQQEFTTADNDTPNGCLAVYRADGEVSRRGGKPGCYEWERDTLPSIFMPRWASRITLEITDVRVERVQDISEEDAEAEGCEPLWPENRGVAGKTRGYRDMYSGLWERINGEGSWAANPLVWVMSFRRKE